MALTAGFKKFIGLISVCAVVGGAMFAYKNGMFPKSAPTLQNEIATEQTSSVPQPINSPISQTEQLDAVVNHVSRVVDQPKSVPSAVVVQDQTQGANAGLDAVLKAGKK